ncbi:prepilin-type N-terminal cleavage/methylation domain-containing protein [Laspinema olomoucense]|uniref:prepilin-type N-terminal cleavage/methylation domain-containing protein n=1 Tax=Laspinema olomoucense TaxID=3231600 RepID=UPI0021BAB7CB|nr:prepilin-type N-terminal cleavage/methylation domain-containing protein [Laspinema sp. D3c]MCT7993928.1 prepilin-type N-terminal cleavage/methylation domain-containing protein [Laspinema sp. D3c]
MVTQKIKLTLKRYFTRTHQPQPESGFTLPELLMAILVGGMVTYGMLALVVSLLGTEREETAKSQVQQEMNQALDYIAAEIQQAVFIYREENFPTNLNLGANVQPVIAFWKATPIEGTDLEDFQQGLGDPPCANHPKPVECPLVLTNLQTFNLVIYGVQQNQPSDPIQWQEGASRIIRYELSQYSDFTTLKQTTAYGTGKPPNSAATFESWAPPPTIDWASEGTFRAVLVDGLDYPEVNEIQCPQPDDYTLATPPNPTTNNSFYACVRSFNPNVSQDAILFLRGNAATRAGQPGSRNTAYLPTLERRVQARTVLNRRPSSQ